MKNKLNPKYILEAAQALLSINSISSNSNDSQNLNCKESAMLSLVNQEIILLKELMQKNNFDKNYNKISLFKESSLSKKLFRNEDIEDVQNIGELLQKLHGLRKSIKLNRPSLANKNISDELLVEGSKFTVNALCKEFSCSLHKINKTFIEERKDLCCSKLELLISQYGYCDKLYNSIQNSLETHSLKMTKNNPEIKKMGFDDITKIAEDIIISESPNFEQSKLVLEGLKSLNLEIIKSVDAYCSKIDLANKFLTTLEHSVYLGFGI